MKSRAALVTSIIAIAVCAAPLVQAQTSSEAMPAVPPQGLPQGLPPGGPPPGGPPGGPPVGGMSGPMEIAIPSFMQSYLNVPADNPPPNTDPHDLEGAYLNIHFFLPGLRTDYPFTPETFNRAKSAADGAMQGIPKGSLSDVCRQPGMSTELALNFPFKIIQTPDEVILLFEEYHSVIRAHMNQPMPANVKPSYEGYSVGHWDGNKLVIETAGIDTRTNLGLSPAPHGPKLTQTLTIEKVKDGRELLLNFTFDDPDNYTRKWSLDPIRVDWRPDLGALQEYDCEETIGVTQYMTPDGVRAN